MGVTESIMSLAVPAFDIRVRFHKQVHPKSPWPELSRETAPLDGADEFFNAGPVLAQHAVLPQVGLDLQRQTTTPITLILSRDLNFTISFQ